MKTAAQIIADLAAEDAQAVSSVSDSAGRILNLQKTSKKTMFAAKLLILNKLISEKCLSRHTDTTDSLECQHQSETAMVKPPNQLCSSCGQDLATVEFGTGTAWAGQRMCRPCAKKAMRAIVADAPKDNLVMATKRFGIAVKKHWNRASLTDQRLWDEEEEG